MADNHKHHFNSFMIFIALCVCTALSVVFDLISIESKVVVAILVFSVAIAKALFVMTYFMHLKFEGKWKYVLLAPTVILALGIPLALLPDIGVHYYTVDTPQLDDHTALTAGADGNAELPSQETPETNDEDDGHTHP